MGKFNTARVANVLATYAVRRLMGHGQGRLGDGFCQPETRHEWIRDILQGMAEVCGQNPAPLLQSFDQRLETAYGASAVEVLTPDSQRHMIQSLGWYASALGRMEGDQRARLSAVKKLLEDVSAYLPWDVGATGVYPARDEVEQALLCAVAQRPIRFTRVLLGGERDPGGVEFLPGMVNDVETVRRTREFQRLTLEYPKREQWPALCIVCMGGGRQADAHTIDADGLDMAVIREYGERFMARPEVRPVWMHELAVPVHEQLRVLRIEPGKAPEEGSQVDETSPLLQGERPLEPDDLVIYELYSSEDDCLTFCLDVLADEQTVFGRQLSDEQEGSYIMPYVVYDEDTGVVRDTMDVELRLPHDEKWFHCKLLPEVRVALKEKMDEFCLARYGEHLSGTPAQCQEEADAPQAEPIM